MTTINFNGMELEEFTSDKPVFFDKPVGALCWNNNGWQGGICEYVIAFIPRSDSNIAVTDHSTWLHMALLPDPPKPRRATNRELARWLAQGNGEVWHGWHGIMSTYFDYDMCKADLPVKDNGDIIIKVRKWSDTEWHEPTVDYIRLEDVK